MAKSKNKGSDTRRDLRREVMEVFQSQPRKPLNHKQIGNALGINDSGVRTMIYQILVSETESGKLKEVERGKFVLASVKTDTLEGTIDITRNGRGFVTVEGFEKDIEIRQGATGFALNGDLVEISYNPKARRPEGKVLKVISRARENYVGILQEMKGNYFFLPSDARIHTDFFVPKEELHKAKSGEKVLVKIISWDNPEKNPVGAVTKVLGKPGEHSVEMNAIMAEYGLPVEFPDDVIKESEAISDAFTEEEIAKRRDFRNVTTFTIDPYDAKDFDDALSYLKLENGNTEVGIHIADVSFYLKPDTALEREAFERATSVYLVDRTIPMLPERLSNFLCSLRPKENKYCFSAVFELNDRADVLNAWYGRTIIHSDRRFTYEEAQEIIETGKGDFSTEIVHLDKLAKALRDQRFKVGALDFDTEEVKFKLDEQGKPIGVFIKKMKDSNKLIEEFMLLANRMVAEHIGKAKGTEQKRTSVFRVHDEPDPTKLKQLATFAQHLGYKMPKLKDQNSVAAIRALINMAEGTPEQDIIKTMAIRSMAKAVYTTNNIGHYGLAFKYYTHFTSPIRRYPDVMIHRLLQNFLDNGKDVSEAEYEMKSKHSSLMEKRAAEAERASIKYKQVEYMLAHVNSVFEGIISGMTGWGFYVEVGETKSEGMISMKSLRGDIYEFDADYYVIRGLRKRKEFHMGDKVMIKVLGGDLQKRTLDFELVE
jgi:ribonuclease R